MNPSTTVELVHSLAVPFFASAIGASALCFGVACLLLWRLYVTETRPIIGARPESPLLFLRATRMVGEEFRPRTIEETTRLDETVRLPRIAQSRERKELPEVMTTQLNKQGMVADYAQTSQFEPNETEFACGFFAGALNKYAGAPGKGPTGSAEAVDQWADHEYDLVYGSHGPEKSGGISIDNMHIVLQHAGCHFWDIVGIAPASSQTTDLAQVTRALDAGYPVVVTIIEATVHDLTGDLPAGNPYSWNPECNAQQCYTHVINLVGHGPGYLLAVDPANIVGPLQGQNSVRGWPRKYDANLLGIQWAAIVQLPHLAPIPSGDPIHWAAGFSAQTQGDTYMVIDITNPVAASWYTQDVGGIWHLKGSAPDLHIQGAILAEYKSTPSLGAAGITELGKVCTLEIPLLDGTGKQLEGGVVFQGYERGGLVYDPLRKFSDPPYSKGHVYKLSIADYWKMRTSPAATTSKEAAYDAIKAVIAKGP